MIKKPIAFPDGQPLNRSSAAQFVQIANRYACRVMIEHNQKLVNAKSMLGLLSLGVDDQCNLMLLAEGDGEEEAVAAIEAWLEK